jgi:integrase
MPPRRRSNPQGLPSRVYAKHGAYHYVDRAGQWHRVGEKWDRVAKEKWAELSSGQAPLGTVAKLLDEFMAWAKQEVISGRRSNATYATNLFEAAQLKLVFGRMLAHQVTRPHVGKYLKKRADRKGVPRPVRANREISLLSSAYSWALGHDDWPSIGENPCFGVRHNREAARKRYVESAELARFGREAAPRWLRCYCILKRVAGLRQADMLRLGRPADGDGWIRTVIGKVKKPARIKRTWAVNIVLRALAANQRERAIASTLLFPTDAGAMMTGSGFKSAWRRAMAKHIAAGYERFRENDIRAKAASDADDLHAAQKLLAHESAATTQRHYRRGVAKIVPLK